MCRTNILGNILQALGLGQGGWMPVGRGVHSFTFQFNVNAFCGIGGAFLGCLRGLQWVLGGTRGGEGRYGFRSGSG
jgi:hypothetical protein